MILESIITCPHCDTATSEVIQPMPASFSILASAAARRCGRSRVIVASSAPTARSRARRSRPSVRPAPLPVVADSRHGKRYRPQLTGLAAEPAHEPARVVDSSGRHSCRPVRARRCSNCYLDHCAQLDGNGVRSQCKAVRTHTLSVHRAVLLGHDHSCARAGIGGHFARLERMGCARRRHYPWRQDHLVDDRAGMGKILRGKTPVTCCLQLVRTPTCFTSSCRLSFHWSSSGVAQALPVTIGSPAARHSGRPSSNRRTLKPRARSAATAS
jgi:hypothetical protein